MATSPRRSIDLVEVAWDVACYDCDGEVGGGWGSEEGESCLQACYACAEDDDVFW